MRLQQSSSTNKIPGGRFASINSHTTLLLKYFTSFHWTPATHSPARLKNKYLLQFFIDKIDTPFEPFAVIFKSKCRGRCVSASLRVFILDARVEGDVDLRVRVIDDAIDAFIEMPCPACSTSSPRASNKSILRAHL